MVKLLIKLTFFSSLFFLFGGISSSETELSQWPYSSKVVACVCRSCCFFFMLNIKGEDKPLE